MALWWVVRDTGEGRKFYVQEANAAVYAALQSAIAGFEGHLVETIPLDAKTAKRIPKKKIGHVLSFDEGKALIEGLD